MKVFRPRTWRGFVKVIDEIRATYDRHRIEIGELVLDEKIGILFRGQADEKWPLATTLERATSDKITVQHYGTIASKIVAELESHTGSDWGFPEWPEMVEEVEAKQRAFSVHLPGYPFLVYLRHLGFPSPLLDWTKSPFIAAYFALIDAHDSNSAVYCYIERPERTKSGWGGAPQISVQGPYVRTHTRHFFQKAWYSIATIWEEPRKSHTFCSHEDVFQLDRQNQDLLFKIILPRSIRKEALIHLNDYNINHYTLFGSEESLVKTLASRLFDMEEA